MLIITYDYWWKVKLIQSLNPICYKIQEKYYKDHGICKLAGKGCWMIKLLLWANNSMFCIRSHSIISLQLHYPGEEQQLDIRGSWQTTYCVSSLKKKTQHGLNIFSQPDFYPFHTSPDSVTSSPFYSTAFPPFLRIFLFHVVFSEMYDAAIR